MSKIRVSPYFETAPLDLEKNLKAKFVAFIDVMGFSNLVSRGSVKDLESYFMTVLDILQRIRRDKGEIQSFLISDSIILIAPPGLRSLQDLLIATKRIQSYLLSQKVLLRGAISHGEVFYDDKRNIIVGKGFIRAYQLEQEAIFPRVIIDPQIIKIVGEDKSDFLRLVHSKLVNEFDDRLVYTTSDHALISDDSLFVDYAARIVTSEKLNGLANVYATIMKNIYSEQKLYAKYMWLRDYFLERLKQTQAVLNSNATSQTTGHKKRIAEWIQKFKRL
jgi:hypothetical protein